ncbi:MAG TPA: nucleotidyltransferase family protein [Cyclobacteriaceae bacterium]
MKTREVGVIILAAGSSSRLGQSKQLLEISGKSLLQRAIDTAFAVCGSDTVVVLGSEADKHQKTLTGKVHIVLNENWTTGMGSSLKVGIRYLLHHLPNIDSVIIMVCDQPLVTAEHLHTLIEKHARSGAPVVASGYASTYGVPVLFHKSIFESISQIKDGHGAKKVIEANLQVAEIVDFQEGSLDIDTPDDISRLQGL